MVRRAALLGLVFTAFCTSLVGCKTVEPPAPAPTADKTASPATIAPATEGKANAKASANQLGAPIDPKAPVVALADVAKSPAQYAGKTFTTAGTVTSVCAHMGCWMELKDDASQAHVKMAGHGFFVPKNANGKKARILAKLDTAGGEACSDEGEKGAKGEKKGCRAEAEEQLGRPLAKLELVADGVELQ